jgi:hypothetical protein
MSDGNDLFDRLDRVPRDKGPVSQRLCNGVGDGDFGGGLGNVDTVGFGRLGDSETVVGKRSVPCIGSGLNEAAKRIV